MWADKDMPDRERQILTALSAGVWLIALAMNVSHVYSHLGQTNIDIDPDRRAILGLAPDVLLLIGVWKLRYRPRSVIAWSMVATGLGWLAWAALSTAKQNPSAWILAVAPIGVAVMTTLALEFRQAAAPAPQPAPPVRPIEKDSRTAGEPPAPAPATDERKQCPSREAARRILLDLDLAGTLAETSNAELGRLHGGSDVWWGKRRGEHAQALQNLGAEASNL